MFAEVACPSTGPVKVETYEFITPVRPLRNPDQEVRFCQFGMSVDRFDKLICLIHLLKPKMAFGADQSQSSTFTSREAFLGQAGNRVIRHLLCRLPQSHCSWFSHQEPQKPDEYVVKPSAKQNRSNPVAPFPVFWARFLPVWKGT